MRNNRRNVGARRIAATRRRMLGPRRMNAAVRSIPRINNRLLGSNDAHNNGNPSAPRRDVFTFVFECLPSTSATGGQFQLKANEPAQFDGSKDTVGHKGTGFRLTDYVSQSFIEDYDYFRVDSIEYFATLSDMARTADNVLLYSSIDYDNATTTSFSNVFKRPNKGIVNLTRMKPSQTVVTFAPRRRISSDAQATLQIVTKPYEWMDSAFATQQIFGNIKFALLVPSGQEQYPDPGNPASVLITSRVTVSFKGRIGD